MELNGADQNEHHTDMSSGMMRPLYGLFALPLFVVCTGILCAYVKHFLNERIHRLIRMLDNYMISVDEDIDQTPVKVLERLDSIVTDDGSSSSELVWDDSIERNAQELPNDMRKESDNNNSTQTSNDSIINVDLSDYLNLVKKIGVAQAKKMTPDNKLRDPVVPYLRTSSHRE